jgi:hypothetical protein
MNLLFSNTHTEYYKKAKVSNPAFSNFGSLKHLARPLANVSKYSWPSLSVDSASMDSKI